MIIGSKCHLNKINFVSIDKLHIAGENLEYCITITNMGVLFDENFTFRVCMVFSIVFIRHTRHTVPNYIKRNIATALVDPILDHANVVMYGWRVNGTIGDENKILVTDNDKIRYIYGLKRHEHITRVTR